MEETREINIDLRKIVYMMRTKVVFILLITIFGGIAAGAFTHFFIDPTYSATAKFFVQSTSDTVSTNSTIDKNTIDASQQLVNFCIYVIKTDAVLDKVAENLQIGSAESIEKAISTSPVEETMAFQVTVTSKDPNLSAKVVNEIAKIAPEEIVRIVNGGGVSVIDYAKVPKEPSSPNLKKNTLVGALAGFILSFAAFFIYEVFDSTITDAKDLEREFEIPILGTIPRLESVEEGANTDASDHDGSKGMGDLPEPVPRPSSALLENIQSMKGDAKHEQKK